MKRISLPLLLGPLLVAGCSVSGSSPSLAPRAIERELSGAPAPTGPCRLEGDGCFEAGQDAEPAPVAPVDDARLRTRLEALLASAGTGNRAFAVVLPSVTAAIGRAGAEGSDSWIAAQQAISRLDAARSPTIDAQAELDALLLTRSREPTSAADAQLMTAATDEVRGLVDTQAVEIERLRASIGGS